MGRLGNSFVACLVIQNNNLEYGEPRRGFNTKHQSRSRRRRPTSARPAPFSRRRSRLTLHPTPCTLHPAPYTLHTLHFAPCTLNPAPYTLPRQDTRGSCRYTSGFGRVPGFACLVLVAYRGLHVWFWSCTGVCVLNKSVRWTMSCASPRFLAEDTQFWSQETEFWDQETGSWVDET